MYPNIIPLLSVCMYGWSATDPITVHLNWLPTGATHVAGELGRRISNQTTPQKWPECMCLIFVWRKTGHFYVDVSFTTGPPVHLFQDAVVWWMRSSGTYITQMLQRGPLPVINGVMDPYKWPYKQVTGVITTIKWSYVKTLLIFGRGPPGILPHRQCSWSQWICQDFPFLMAIFVYWKETWRPGKHLRKSLDGCCKWIYP